MFSCKCGELVISLNQSNILNMCGYIIMYIQMSSSESQPRKVELTCAPSKTTATKSILHMTIRHQVCICSYKNQPHGSDIH